MRATNAGHTRISLSCVRAGSPAGEWPYGAGDTTPFWRFCPPGKRPYPMAALGACVRFFEAAEPLPTGRKWRLCSCQKRKQARSGRGAEISLLAGIAEKARNIPDGLSQAEAQLRLTQFGCNEISEKKVNPFVKFITYFWGPIPWMIEAAAERLKAKPEDLDTLDPKVSLKSDPSKLFFRKSTKPTCLQLWLALLIGYPRPRQAPRPPSSGRTFSIPFFLSSSATRALVASFGQVQ